MAAYFGATVFDDVFDIDVIRTLDPQTAAKVDPLSLADQQEVLWQICRNAVSPGFFRARGAGDSVGADHARDRVRFLQPDVARTRSAGRDRRHGDDDVDRAGFRTLDPALQGVGCGEVLHAWHEYLTFVITLQALFTGVATLVWLLVVHVPDPGRDPDTVSNNGPPAS
jgi:hypothetical protein